MHAKTSRSTLKFVAALAAVAAVGCSDQTGPAPVQSVPQQPSVNFAQTGVLAPQWLVQLKTFSSMPTVHAAVIAAGGSVVREFPEIGVMAVEGLAGPQMVAIQAQGDIRVFNRDRDLQWVPTTQEAGMGAAADADATGPSTSGTNQSGAFFFNSFQWGMKVISAPAAWAASPGGSGRTVCVLDTGIDTGHNEFANGKVTTAISMNTDASDARNQTPIDYNLHGTFVSSIISSNGAGVASVAPDAKICSIKVLGVTGSGSFNDVIAGIMYAASIHADVINMSLGAYFDLRGGGNNLVQAMQAAVDYATAQGVVVVAASGNNGVNLDTDYPDFISLPAQLKNVISVGATGPTHQLNFDALASYSNYGGVTGVALMAPGGSGAPFFQQDLIIGACSRFAVGFSCAANSYLIGNGTSFAAPHVAGAAALFRSKFTANLRPATVRRCLLGGTDNIGPSATFGAGRLNVLKSLSCAI
jgi:subtilisin family serine protease